MNDDVKPWEMQPGEPYDLFNLFEIYLLHSRRNLTNTAKFANKSKATISRYAKKWNWYYRAQLYDGYRFVNYKNSILDNVQSVKSDLLFQRLRFNQLAVEYNDILFKYLQYFESHAGDAHVNKKVNFIKKVVSTIHSVTKLLDFELSPQLEQAKERKREYDQFLKLGNEINSINGVKNLSKNNNLISFEIINKSHLDFIKELDNPVDEEIVSGNRSEGISKDYLRKLSDGELS